MVSGSARGRRLQAPPGTAVRPTSDRVKEAIFDTLGSRGGVEGRCVLDLFAGSGALGIEALSRGARAVTFVDDDRRALEAVRANLAATGLGDRATVVQADALAWLDVAPAFDVALVDPPYAFEAWPVLFEHLRAELVVVESDRDVDTGPRYRAVRAKRYGGTVVTLAYARREPGPHGEGARDDE